MATFLAFQDRELGFSHVVHAYTGSVRRPGHRDLKHAKGLPGGAIRSFIWALMDERLEHAADVFRAYPRLLNTRGYAWGQTPLHYVAVEGKTRAVIWLLRRGANCNLVDDDFESPLGSVARQGHIDLVRLLLAHGARTDSRSEFNGSPLHSAIRAGHLKIARLLLCAGANPNARGGIFDPRPLHEVPELRSREAIRLLLGFSANTEARAAFYHTPLMSAVCDGQWLKVSALLDHGADAKTRCNSGFDGNISVLHWSVWNQDLVTTRLLLDAGANPNAKTARGERPDEWRGNTPRPLIKRLLEEARSRRGRLDGGR